MGMNIAIIGNGYAPQELPQDRAPHRAQVRNDPAKQFVPRTLEAALPGDSPNADLHNTTTNLEKISLAFNKKLRFVVDSQLDEVIVKVIDPETDKVIKELPPEELQRLHRKIKEMIGILFDEQV